MAVQYRYQSVSEPVLKKGVSNHVIAAAAPAKERLGGSSLTVTLAAAATSGPWPQAGHPPPPPTRRPRRRAAPGPAPVFQEVDLISEPLHWAKLSRLTRAMIISITTAWPPSLL